MSLVKELLLEKKIFEAHEEVEKFMESNGVEPGSCLQRIEFDGAVYKTEDQVKDYLAAHWLDHMKVEKDGSGYVALMFDEMGFIESTMKTLPVRDGISIVVGVLRPMTEDNPLLFDLKDEGMKFSDVLPSVIELACVVSGFHARYGEVKITEADLKSFKDNFENKVCGIDLSIDFDHETREAAGWLKEVFLSEDSKKLYGVVKWTPKGALALNDREFRYFSPEFNFNYLHPHTQKSHGPTLLGGALVNRPFLKMDAIVGLKDKQSKGVSYMETIALSDHKARINEVEKQLSDIRLSESTLKNEKKEMEAQNTQLSEELKTLKAKLIKKESEEKHQKLFDDGKINKAQLDALNEGKSMFDVLALSEKMNTEPQGNGGNSKQIQLSDEEMKMCKELDLSPEDYVKYNKEGE